MSDLWANRLKYLKVHHILIAVVAAGLIWGLAHVSSEPRTTVKVLWGLVEYTKSQEARKRRTEILSRLWIRHPEKTVP